MQERVGSDWRVLRRAWCVLEHEYWLVGVLDASHSIDDIQAVFRRLIGLPQLARTTGRRKLSVIGAAGYGMGGGLISPDAVVRISPEEVVRAADLAAKIQSINNQPLHSSAVGPWLQSQVGDLRDTLVEITARNRLDVVLFEAARRSFDSALTHTEPERRRATLVLKQRSQEQAAANERRRAQAEREHAQAEQHYAESCALARRSVAFAFVASLAALLVRRVQAAAHEKLRVRERLMEQDGSAQTCCFRRSAPRPIRAATDSGTVRSRQCG